MKTINDYLKDVATTTETGTDYAVAQALGLSTSHVANYRRGRAPDDNVCLLIAERLGIEPWEVIAAANAERQMRLANDDQAERWKTLWLRVRKAGKTGSLGAIIALVVFGSFSMPSTTYAKSASDGSLYYTHWLRRLRAMLGGSLLPA